MRKSLIYGVSLLLIVVVWEFFGKSNQTVRLLISSPSLIYEFFIKNTNDLLFATKVTFMEAVIGLIIATSFSFLMMIICFYYPKFMDYILPVMITSQVIPIIVLAPFFIILMGIGLASKIAMAAVISFFPIFVNFAQGYRTIERNIHELMYIYNAPLSFKIKKVYFPLSMPSIMAGLKVSATLAVIGAIVAEFSGAEVGLGKNLFLSAKRLEPDLMMTSLILSSLLGGILYSFFYLIEQKIGKWYLP